MRRRLQSKWTLALHGSTVIPARYAGLGSDFHDVETQSSELQTGTFKRGCAWCVIRYDASRFFSPFL